MHHTHLTLEKWGRFSLVEQMANIGSEVERVIAWKGRNKQYSEKALERALELIDLTLADPKNRGRLKEVARMREVLADHFYGNNDYNSTDKSWRKYFYSFNYAAALAKGR
jgi:uncharacterized protein with von Willebrand factor type A (vWA) domain